jgi:hypothetical protein
MRAAHPRHPRNPRLQICPIDGISAARAIPIAFNIPRLQFISNLTVSRCRD